MKIPFFSICPAIRIPVVKLELIQYLPLDLRYKYVIRSFRYYITSRTGGDRLLSIKNFDINLIFYQEFSYKDRLHISGCRVRILPLNNSLRLHTHSNRSRRTKFSTGTLKYGRTCRGWCSRGRVSLIVLKMKTSNSAQQIFLARPILIAN